jgi:hypothetical protein
MRQRHCMLHDRKTLRKGYTTHYFLILNNAKYWRSNRAPKKALAKKQAGPLFFGKRVLRKNRAGDPLKGRNELGFSAHISAHIFYGSEVDSLGRASVGGGWWGRYLYVWLPCTSAHRVAWRSVHIGVGLDVWCLIRDRISAAFRVEWARVCSAAMALWFLNNINTVDLFLCNAHARCCL